MSSITQRPEYSAWPSIAGFMFCHRDELAVAVEDQAREVETLAEDRRVRRPHHREPHLLADVHELRVEDLEPDGVKHWTAPVPGGHDLLGPPGAR